MMIIMTMIITIIGTIIIINRWRTVELILNIESHSQKAKIIYNKNVSK